MDLASAAFSVIVRRQSEETVSLGKGFFLKERGDGRFAV